MFKEFLSSVNADVDKKKKEHFLRNVENLILAANSENSEMDQSQNFYNIRKLIAHKDTKIKYQKINGNEDIENLNFIFQHSNVEILVYSNNILKSTDDDDEILEYTFISRLSNNDNLEISRCTIIVENDFKLEVNLNDNKKVNGAFDPLFKLFEK